MNRHSLSIVVAMLCASTAQAQLAVKSVTKPVWKPPTVEVEGGRIRFDTSVKLAAPHQKPVFARVRGRIRTGSTDRLYLESGLSRSFTLKTSDFTKGGVKVDIPAVDVGKLSHAPIGGRELACYMAEKTGGRAHRIACRDYASQKQLVDSGKTVVFDVWANTPADYGATMPKEKWPQVWNPVTNEGKPVLKPSVSEYSARRGARRGMVLTHVTDTKNAYEPDRWIHQLYDPQSGLFAMGSSSTFKYRPTIMDAWVIK
jgi:ABC-type cobalt transport system substrate-binding protein